MESNNPGNYGNPEQFDEIQIDINETTPLVNTDNRPSASSNPSTIFFHHNFDLTPLVQTNNLLSASNKISMIGVGIFFKGVADQSLGEMVTGGVVLSAGLAINIALLCLKSNLSFDLTTDIVPTPPRPR